MVTARPRGGLTAGGPWLRPALADDTEHMFPRRTSYGPDTPEGRRLRAMYPGGHANAAAKRYVAVWNRLLRLGLLPRRWVVLEVPGRTSGRPVRLPLGMARHEGRWYLVSMLGECNWTKNVRAAGGDACLLRVRRHPVRLTEVPPRERGPILRGYVRKVPGGRPHVGVALDASNAEFAEAGARHPMFRVEAR